MSRDLFDSLGEVHRYDDLEDLLDHVTRVIVDTTGHKTALITFYFGDEVCFGATGCPPDIKERFRSSYRMTSKEKQRRKREVMLQFGRPGTNVCFIPAGEGPRPANAYIRGEDLGGSWHPDDRLVIFMRDWQDDILGMLSLDNPASGHRPDLDTYKLLEDVDLYINVIAKIAENRFWSLRLRESEAAYRGVFNATTDAFLVLDPDGTVVEANPAACRLYDYGYVEMIGMNIKSLIRPEEYGECDRILQRIGEGFAFRIDAEQLRRGEREFSAEVHGTTFFYRGRLRLLTATQDVTEKKRLYQRLLEEQKEESIVAIAGGVAHDFNNILMGITGSVSLLRPHVTGSSEATRHCERIAASADRLSHLTGQLLAIARGVHSEPRPVTLAQVVRDNLMLVRGMVGRQFDLDLDFTDRPWTVLADRVQLGQVLLNLTQNACEAMSRGGKLRVQVSNVARERGWACQRTGTHPPGDYVCLRVADDGLGMDVDTQRKLFDPYFSTKPTGSGLGLAAVLGIVRRHHGSIEVESAAGEGTSIDILLPRTEVEPTLAPPPPTRRPNVIARPRVLLVEDDDVVRQVTEEMLSDLECRIVAVSSGAAALETYQKDDDGFDLVLLDVAMPEMTGVEVSEALFGLDREARIILTSGHTEHLVREHIPHGGRIRGFLQKPYSMAQLEASISDALRLPEA